MHASPLPGHGPGPVVCSSNEDSEAPAYPPDQITGTLAGIPRPPRNAPATQGTGPGGGSRSDEGDGSLPTAGRGSG